MEDFEIISKENNPEVLASLANHPSLSVRCRVAANSNTPECYLEKLIHDKDSRFFVCLNKSLTSMLAFRIYDEIVETYNRIFSIDVDSLDNLFSNKNCPLELYELASSSHVVAVRLCLGRCVKTPSSILAKMVLEEKNKYILSYLSQNPSLPPTYKLLLIMES